MRILHFLGCLVLLASCSSMEDLEYDIAPIVPQIYLNDKDGRDLLDPYRSDSEFDPMKVTVVYEDSTYTVKTRDELVETRAYMPWFFGLAIQKDAFGRWLLSFGELDGTEDIDNKDIMIDWGNGCIDVITIFNNFKWKANGSPSIKRRFYVNGKKTDSDVAVFTFVKDM